MKPQRMDMIQCPLKFWDRGQVFEQALVSPNNRRGQIARSVDRTSRCVVVIMRFRAGAEILRSKNLGKKRSKKQLRP